MRAHDLHTRKILTEIEAGRPVSQRRLSKQLGIALGLTNLLVRRIVKKGYIKVVNVKPNRVAYLITPAGIAEKSRITSLYLQDTLHLYTEARERIRERLETLSDGWESMGLNGNGAGEKRIVFYGAGDVAEIAFISLQATDLRLVGVVDDRRKRPFFGIPVHRPDWLCDASGDGFSCVVVMSFRHAQKIRGKLDALSFPRELVFWL